MLPCDCLKRPELFHGPIRAIVAKASKEQVETRGKWSLTRQEHILIATFSSLKLSRLAI